MTMRDIILLQSKGSILKLRYGKTFGLPPAPTVPQINSNKTSWTPQQAKISPSHKQLGHVRPKCVTKFVHLSKRQKSPTKKIEKCTDRWTGTQEDKIGKRYESVDSKQKWPSGEQRKPVVAILQSLLCESQVLSDLSLTESLLDLSLSESRLLFMW